MKAAIPYNHNVLTRFCNCMPSRIISWYALNIFHQIAKTIRPSFLAENIKKTEI
jgi:hypothetical protein